jgi:hypothetical protein
LGLAKYFIRSLFIIIGRNLFIVSCSNNIRVGIKNKLLKPLVLGWTSKSSTFKEIARL